MKTTAAVQSENASAAASASPAAWELALGNACFRFRAISVFPVILLILFFFRPGDAGRLDGLLRAAGFLVALAGALTRIVAVGHAKPFTSGRENFLKAEDLNTTGLYAIVRNPLYVGNFLVYNGVLLAYGNPAAIAFFNLFFIANYHFIILSEERYLLGRFGDAYRDYCRRVPRALPRFSLYRRNERRFDPRRVIYKEKNTTLYWVFFLAVVLLLKQYRLHDGAISGFWWHVAPVLALLALNVFLTLRRASKPA